MKLQASFTQGTFSTADYRMGYRIAQSIAENVLRVNGALPNLDPIGYMVLHRYRHRYRQLQSMISGQCYITFWQEIYIK